MDLKEIFKQNFNKERNFHLDLKSFMAIGSSFIFLLWVFLAILSLQLNDPTGFNKFLCYYSIVFGGVLTFATGSQISL